MSRPARATVGEQSAIAARRRPVYATLKRALDVVVAALGLVVASPLLALAAIAVRLDSRGPVFFLQERIGKDFRPFRIYKLRTMATAPQQPAAQITVGADPRITRVGSLLRKTKIDELPQLFNVLVGDMSLVGPRPEVPKYVEMFRDEYAEVLSVRPGLTDPASVKYRNESAILAASPDPEEHYVRQILPDKIALARAYIARATLASDLAVLLRTLLRIAR